MKNSTSNSNFWLTTALIVAVVILRIITNQLNLFNFTPIIAVSLFAGAKFKDNKVAFLLPMFLLFITDATLAYLNNFDVFHSTFLFTYGSIFLIILLGKLLGKEEFNIVKTTGFSLLSSLLFFIITNFGTWLFGNLYTLNWQGLVECFVKAIPFSQYSWLTDLFYVITLFSIYNWITLKNTTPAKETVNHKK